MDRSIGKKISFLFVVVLVVNISAIFVITRPTTLEAKKVNIEYLKNGFKESNKSLDLRYESVASKIQEYVKKRELVTSKKDTRVQNIIIRPEIIEICDTSIIKNSLPKVAIIMDDIGFYRHADNIKKLPFPITPSIFPPNDNFPNTSKIARGFDHYMVHFPMEAYNYKNISEKAINISDSLEKLEGRVNLIVENFPNLIAINNHTGSKFTCNLNAMKKFFSVLQKYDIDFIDSKTASKTQTAKAAKLYKRALLQRDVFLDNEVDVSKIKERLKEVVRVAKRNGKAIAICHPKDETFQALMSSKDILKDVELVYINELL
jgi:polysaccharide deacetylase 2 family uncharacterized protein YibQ